MRTNYFVLFLQHTYIHTHTSHFNHINEKLQRLLEYLDVGLGDPVLTPGSRVSVVCGDGAGYIVVTAGTVCVILEKFNF